MRNKRSYVFFVLSFLFLIIFGGKGSLVQAADYNDLGIKTNIEADKSWTIRFNQKLDESTLNDSNILVTDENGQQVPINISIGDDGSSVKVSPKDKYAYGKTYNISISDNVKAQNKAVATKPAKMEFSIKDNPDSSTTTNGKYTVCLDPGRGGYDSGNIGQSGVKEKDVDLSVALKVGNILQENGVNVIYTRNSDNVSWNSDNELQSRFDVSNNGKADYFVSIHCNYADNQSANGIETYYKVSDDIAKNLAQAVQDSLISGTGATDRGIKEALPQHEILKGTSASAIMIELGFMSNPSESAVLGTDDFQNKSASAIANGILNSLNLVDKNSSGATISTINDLSNTVTQGTEYTLPVTIPAVMSDGSTKNVTVIWNPGTVDTSKIGICTYLGTVAGYSKPVGLTLTIASESEPPSTPDSSNSKVICIDPGHGLGSDIGASGINGLLEDNVTLPVGLKVGKILEDHGVKVVYTRTTDMSSTPMSVADSLQRRCDISNNANAAYFISIHNNSADDPSASGTETWDNPNNPASADLAAAIQNNIVQQVGTYDRGLKDGYGRSLYVIKNTSAPAVLVELGFLTNPDDAAKLSSDEYQQKFAQAIADGILQVLGN